MRTRLFTSLGELRDLARQTGECGVGVMGFRRLCHMTLVTARHAIGAAVTCRDRLVSGRDGS